jgi:hypothetical protein
MLAPLHLDQEIFTISSRYFHIRGQLLTIEDTVIKL